MSNDNWDEPPNPACFTGCRRKTRNMDEIRDDEMLEELTREDQKRDERIDEMMEKDNAN